MTSIGLGLWSNAIVRRYTIKPSNSTQRNNRNQKGESRWNSKGNITTNPTINVASIQEFTFGRLPHFLASICKDHREKIRFFPWFQWFTCNSYVQRAGNLHNFNHSMIDNLRRFHFYRCLPHTDSLHLCLWRRKSWSSPSELLFLISILSE